MGIDASLIFKQSGFPQNAELIGGGVDEDEFSGHSSGEESIRGGDEAGVGCKGGMGTDPEGFEVVIEIEAVEVVPDPEESIANNDGGVGVGSKRFIDGDGLWFDGSVGAKVIEPSEVVLSGDEESFPDLKRSGDIEIVFVGGLEAPESFAGVGVPTAEGVEVVSDDLRFAFEESEGHGSVGGCACIASPDDFPGFRIECG